MPDKKLLLERLMSLPLNTAKSVISGIKESRGHWPYGFGPKYSKLPSRNKSAVRDVAKQLGIKDNEIESWYESANGRRVLAGYYNGIINDGRVRRNDSPTPEESEKRTLGMHRAIIRGTSGRIPTIPYSPSGYDVPYIIEKEAMIPGLGRTSMNAIDSLAKYAVLADISGQEALGLFGQETIGGAVPYANYKNAKPTKGLSGEALRKVKEYNNEVKLHNRSIGNSNYFREYGIIPANYLVRDFEYDRAGHEVDRSVPPLLHAFKYFKEGKYNPGDPNHTRDVLSKGKQLLDTKIVQDYIRNSPYAKGLRLYVDDKQ